MSPVQPGIPRIERPNRPQVPKRKIEPVIPASSIEPDLPDLDFDFTEYITQPNPTESVSEPDLAPPNRYVEPPEDNYSKVSVEVKPSDRILSGIEKFMSENHEDPEDIEEMKRNVSRPVVYEDEEDEDEDYLPRAKASQSPEPIATMMDPEDELEALFAQLSGNSESVNSEKDFNLANPETSNGEANYLPEPGERAANSRRDSNVSSTSEEAEDFGELEDLFAQISTFGDEEEQGFSEENQELEDEDGEEGGFISDGNSPNQINSQSNGQDDPDDDEDLEALFAQIAEFDSSVKENDARVSVIATPDEDEETSEADFDWGDLESFVDSMDPPSENRPNPSAMGKNFVDAEEDEDDYTQMGNQEEEFNEEEFSKNVPKPLKKSDKIKVAPQEEENNSSIENANSKNGKKKERSAGEKTSFAEKFNKFKNQVLAELQGKDSPDGEAETKVSKNSEDEEEENERRPRKTGGSKKPEGNFFKKLLRILFFPFAFIGKIITKVLEFIFKIFGSIPGLGQLIKKITPSAQTFETIGKVVAVAALIATPIILVNSFAPSETKTFNFPDNGVAIFDTFRLDSKLSKASGDLHNNGDIILRVTPSFTIWTIQPSLNPVTWVTYQKAGSCESAPVAVDIDTTEKIEAKCGKIEGLLPRVNGEVS